MHRTANQGKEANALLDETIAEKRAEKRRGSEEELTRTLMERKTVAHLSFTALNHARELKARFLIEDKKHDGEKTAQRNSLSGRKAPHRLLAFFFIITSQRLSIYDVKGCKNFIV